MALVLCACGVKQLSLIMLARAASSAAAAAAPLRSVTTQQMRTMAISAEAVRIYSHGKAERVMKCVASSQKLPNPAADAFRSRCSPAQDGDN